MKIKDIIEGALPRFEKVEPGDVTKVTLDQLVEFVEADPVAAAKQLGLAEEKRILGGKRRASHSLIAKMKAGELFERELLHECWIKVDGADVRLSRAKWSALEALLTRSSSNVERAVVAHDETTVFCERLRDTMVSNDCDVEAAMEQLRLFADQEQKAA